MNSLMELKIKMDNSHIFEHLDYRDFLRQHFPPKGEGRGRRSALAKSLGCEISFVSLVLNKHAHFTGEHVFATADFLGLTTGEIEFLLLLFSWNRAGSKKLETYYRRAMDAILAERGKIKNRIESRHVINLEKQLEYYSHWAYTAVHMCLLNPKINSANQVAEYLGLSIAQANRILEFFYQFFQNV